MEPEESLPAVLRNETDVAVAHEYDLLPRPLDPLFERRELLDDPVVLAIPADSALSPADSALSLEAGALSPATGGPVPLATLAGQPFLAPRQGTSCAEMIQRACAGPASCPAWSPAPATSRSCSAWSRPARASPWCPGWPPGGCRRGSGWSRPPIR